MGCVRGTGSLLSGPPAPPACGRPPPPWDPSGPHSRGVRRCPPHLHPLPARAPPVTPARAHSLRPGHPAKQQLAVGMGGEAGVEAGMCAGGEGRGPSEGAEVGEGPVERRPDENRGRPRWEERQAERLREAEGKRERGRRQSQRRGAGQTEATRSRTVSGEASRGSAAPGDSGPAPTHGPGCSPVPSDTRGRRSSAVPGLDGRGWGWSHDSWVGRQRPRLSNSHSRGP